MEPTELPDTPSAPSKTRRDWTTLIFATAMLVSNSLAVVVGWALRPPQPVAGPAPAPSVVYIKGDVNPDGTVSADPHSFGHGWVPDPDAVAEVVAAMPPAQRVFAQTPAGQVTDPLPKSVYGWKAYVQLFGQPPPIKNQGKVGSCVGFGNTTAVERTLAAEIVRRKGTKEEWSRYAEEATYGGSRVEIGKGKIRGDGSVGAWAAQWVTQYGMVPRKQYPSTDLSQYDETRCRAWGSSGVPAEFETVAKQFPVKSFTQVKSWSEAKTALAQDYYIGICSNQGFTMQRDSRGVCKAQGTWGHCMCLDGYYVDTDGKEYGHITNSWGGEAMTGPVGWGEPNPDGFWADSNTVDRMAKQGDTWAYSGVTGFPARKVHWTVQRALDIAPFRAEVALAW